MSVRLQRADELVPKFTGFLSFCGSSWIVFEVLSDPKKRTHVYHRILLMMSIFDCVTSFLWIMSSWPINPEKSPNTIYAAGNDITCNLQGFFFQLCYGTFLYNGFLSLYYLLLIRYNWSAQKIARKIEPWYHGFVFVLSVGTAVAGFPLELYNSLGQSCWIAPYPLDCEQSFRHGGATDCERGDNAVVYAWAFLIVWVWASILFSTVAMFLVFLSVRTQEKRNERYDFGRGRIAAGRTTASSEQSRPQSQTQRRQLLRSDVFRKWKQKKSTQVAKSCLLYLGAFYVVWLGSLIFEIWRTINPTASPWTNLYLVVTLPLQGIMNFAVYVRPRYLDYKRRNPDDSMFVLVKKSLFKPLIRWRRAKEAGVKNDDDGDDNDFEIVAEVPNDFNSENNVPSGSNHENATNCDDIHAMDEGTSESYDSKEEADIRSTSSSERGGSSFADNPVDAAARYSAQVCPDDLQTVKNKEERTIRSISLNDHGNINVGLTRRTSTCAVSLSEITLKAI